MSAALTPSPTTPTTTLIRRPLAPILWSSLRRRTLPRDLLVCGPAGTGKTYAILEWLHCLARDNAGLRILFCRATRAALTESVLVTYEQEILPLDGLEGMAAGCQRRVRAGYRYPSGSEVVLGGLDTPSKVLSTAWDFVFLNEAIEATEDAWESILTRMSRPGRRSRFGVLVGDTNPGHPSHWLKRRIDAGRLTLWDTRHEANPAMYRDGRWTPAGLRYFGTLNRLTGTRRARLRDGLWAVGEGLWFDAFNPAVHVSGSAEYDPALPVFLSVDPGVFTGAVFWQVRSDRFVNVFADYLCEGQSAQANAAALRTLAAERCEGRITQGYSDPAGGARNPVGPTVLNEYAKAKLHLKPWSQANPSVSDSLANVEAMLAPVGGPPRLTIHPRCRPLVEAFLSYRRAKQGGQWADYPEDPQHPAEDLIDALRGGLYARFRVLKTFKTL